MVWYWEIKSLSETRSTFGLGLEICPSLVGEPTGDGGGAPRHPTCGGGELPFRFHTALHHSIPPRPIDRTAGGDGAGEKTHAFSRRKNMKVCSVLDAVDITYYPRGPRRPCRFCARVRTSCAHLLVRFELILIAICCTAGLRPPGCDAIDRSMVFCSVQLGWILGCCCRGCLAEGRL